MGNFYFFLPVYARRLLGRCFIRKGSKVLNWASDSIVTNSGGRSATFPSFLEIENFLMGKINNGYKGIALFNQAILKKLITGHFAKLLKKNHLPDISNPF